jgi:hypothetical protein
MNTKTFAQQSRTLLMEGVSNKLLYWGFNIDGSITEEPKPVAGGYTFRGKVYDDDTVPKLWKSLQAAVKSKGFDVVKEEAAYTWFNRMMALRIMAKNEYEEAQLEYVPGMVHTPQLLQKARQGQFSFLNKNEQDRLKSIIGDYTKDQEAFALLLVGYCHSNKMLNNVFGKIDDYTELLLPDNMLQDSGFLHLLNTTDAISDDQYKEVELIGWLYQFYISERKAEVFASFKKKKKAEAKDIPAATQIFTPNWIVKYMVQNTVGKIWLDKNPNSKIKANMKYLVENESYTSSLPIITEVSQLTLIDPAVGSGHILVEGFDLLYQMYMEEYYTPEEAVESILKNNLFGLDLDDRAVQLATFAVLLKAAEKYRDVFAKGWLPNVYTMPEYDTFSKQEIKDFLGAEGSDYEIELTSALRLMEQAKNLGSVMNLSLSNDGRIFIEKRFTELKNTDFWDINIEIVFQKIKNYIPVLLLLSNKFTAVVANPPYMGSVNMNSGLKEYLETNYSKGKNDLYSTFIFVVTNLVKHGFKGGLIAQQSWMFTASFENIRKFAIQNLSITSVLHLGVGTFGADFGTASFVFSKNNPSDNNKTIFFDLSRRFDVYEKESEFLINRTIRFANYSLVDFKAIPKYIFAYRLRKDDFQLFRERNYIDKIGITREGLATGDNDKYLRNWHEINYFKFNVKWFPYVKGGNYRKWFGNIYLLINWENDGYEVKNNKTDKGRVRSHNYNGEFGLKEGISWGAFSSKEPSFRKVDAGSYFDSKGSMLFLKGKKEYTIESVLGYLNSNVALYFLDSISENRDTKPGTISVIPFKELSNSENEIIGRITLENIFIAKEDWDFRETSWNFKTSTILSDSKSIKLGYQNWLEKVSITFIKLHQNEEELNRIFIDIYCLQDRLKPIVALKDITILQEELNKKDLEKLESVYRKKGAEAIELPINKAEVISQFISYAIGLFMGRYRLDKPGLNIAHPNPTKEELASYKFNSVEVKIDKDAILPLMGKNCNFSDDVVKKFNQLLDTIWGHDQRTENINFIQECLNKDIEKFLINDFWSYHCSMYKKTPIYWLFSSKKGAFQVLVYMHRMNEFTVEKIRANYLLEHLKFLKSEIAQKEAKESSLSTAEAKQLDKLRADLRECEQYDLVLKNVADQQIKFDLDDGVAKNYELFKSVVAKIK